MSKRLPAVKVYGYPICTLEIEPIGVKRTQRSLDEETPVFMDLFLL